MCAGAQGTLLAPGAAAHTATQADPAVQTGSPRQALASLAGFQI